VVLLLAAGLTACGGGGSSSSATTESTPSEANTSETTESSKPTEASGGAMAEAKETISGFIGQPSPFPVTEKLKEVPKGATIDYVDCGTPFCALTWELADAAGKTLGVKMQRVKAGEAASTVTAAFDTVIAQEPSAVIAGGFPMEIWANKLKELQAKNIPVVTTGIADAEEYGIEGAQASNRSSELEGELMAAYTFAEMTGEETNAVFYETPELSFTTIIAESYVSELEKLCPSCSVRVAKIGVEELGSKAPDTIVSDLQANPDTNVAALGSSEVWEGTPSALQAAGIEIEAVGSGPAPTELQYIKEGKYTAGLGFDEPVLAWSLVDEAARGIIGQKLTGLEAEGIPVLQFLREEDITFDPSKGWTGYPEFAEKFAELWGVKG